MVNLELPHRRYNPLTREWVLVSPHRARRPWLGQVEDTPPAAIPTYDPNCYLCPGNTRVGGQHNPDYSSTFVFDNDFQALLTPDQAALEHLASEKPGGDEALFQAEAENGISRVVCFSPRHDLSIPQLSQAEVEDVVRAWSEQTRQLGEKAFIRYVQVFENKGAMMGASNPHPHSQIWATSSIPNEPAKEMAAQVEYLRQHSSCLLCDYLQAEQQRGERIVARNDHFTVVVPFWAVWPFEALLLAQRHAASLTDLTREEESGLADILRQLTARYDALFKTSFPYSMGFHQAPVDGDPHAECHLHAHYYPPLLRSATVRKFMVGFEMLAMPQRDLTPETAAQRLREAGEIKRR